MSTGAAAGCRNKENGAYRYQRHQPENTLLYRIVERYYPEFTAYLAEQGAILYIFQKGDKVSPLKSTSRWQGREGDRPSERSLSTNLRADEQKSHIRPNPWAREHNIPKPVRRTWGMVNAAVVQGKIMFLPGEICPALRPSLMVALHVAIHGVVGQKSADGIVAESY